MRSVLGLLLSLAMLAPATAVPTTEPSAPPQYGPGARVVVVHAPHATLRLMLATHVAEDLALHCVTALPPHGGMLVSARNPEQATVFGARYEFAHVDEVAIDASGTVVAAVLDAARAGETSQAAFFVRARYIIDVPAGEALADGLVPGQKVRIDADAATLTAERDHSVRATPRCAPRSDAPAATPFIPCIPPGPSARAIPVSFDDRQRDVPTDIRSLVFFIGSTVDAKVTLRSANHVIGPLPLNPAAVPPNALRTMPPGGDWHVYSTPAFGPLQPSTEYLVSIDGIEYPGPCQKRYGAALLFRTR